MNSFRIGTLNCQGLKGKYELPEFREMVERCLIFGVCETWLKKDKDEKSSINIPGYNFYACSRVAEKGSSRGGVGVFIKEEYKKHIKILLDISTENYLWCKLKKDFFNFQEDV